MELSTIFEMEEGKPVTYYQNTARELSAQLRNARVDHASLETLLKPCQMMYCKGTCCHDGVYVSLEEKEEIEKLVSKNKTKLESYGLDFADGVCVKISKGKGERWKTFSRNAVRSELAQDYPQHFPLTRCVFLDENSHCGLQRFAMDEGLHPWFYKPLTCWIHPIAIQSNFGEAPIIRIVTSLDDPQRRAGYAGYASCTHCGREDSGGSPAYDVLKQELIALGHLANRDFLGELTAPAVNYETLWKD